MLFLSTLALYLYLIALVTSGWIAWTDLSPQYASLVRSWLASWRQRASAVFSGLL